MSRIIDESIAGMDLFTPTINDYFGVGTATMPNGDNSFVINPSSNTNPDYRAFANAPTLTPNVLKQAGNAFSVSMWVRMPSGGTSQNKATSVFKVQNSDSGNTGGLGYPLSCCVQINTNGLFSLQMIGIKIPNLPISGFPNPGNLGTNAWVFGVFRIPTPGNAPSTYLGGAESIVAGAGVIASGTETFDSNNRFAIGRYSDNDGDATYTGYVPFGRDLNKPLHIGKLAFHDHLLSLTECSMLYHSMLTGS